jgi:hypothetical protein
MGPYSPAWELDRPLYGLYVRPDNIGHVQDSTLATIITAQRRVQDRATRQQLIFDIQRYAAAQQYSVYLLSPMLTASWQPYMQHYAPALTFDYGTTAPSRAGQFRRHLAKRARHSDLMAALGDASAHPTRHDDGGAASRGLSRRAGL